MISGGKCESKLIKVEGDCKDEYIQPQAIGNVNRGLIVGAVSFSPSSVQVKHWVQIGDSEERSLQLYSHCPAWQRLGVRTEVDGWRMSSGLSSGWGGCESVGWVMVVSSRWVGCEQ